MNSANIGLGQTRAGFYVSLVFLALTVLLFPRCSDPLTDLPETLGTCFDVAPNRRTEFFLPEDDPDPSAAVAVCHAPMFDYDGDGVPNIYDGKDGSLAGDYTQFAVQADDGYYEISNIYQLQAIMSLQCPPRVPALNTEGTNLTPDMMEREGDLLNKNDGSAVDMAECTGNMGDLDMRLDASYRLMTDIDASITQEMNYDGDFDASAGSTTSSGQGFLRIASSGFPFDGSFDGNGYMISNLTINQPTSREIGLIGISGASSAISNVGLVNVDITAGDTIGGLVGYNDGGSISNSYVTGNVNNVSSASFTNSVGGLVGDNRGDISNCYAAGSVVGSIGNTTAIGGLVGANDGGNISDSYAAVDVTGANNQAGGGLVGSHTTGGVISNSYAVGDVTGDDYLGGLMGVLDSGTSVSNSYAVGSVMGTGTNIGGLVGFVDSSASVDGTNYFVDPDGGANGIGGGACSGSCTQAPDLQTIFDALFTMMGWTTPPWTDRSNEHPCLAGLSCD